MTASGRELEGRVCVVTGGSRGIGAAISAAFVAQGGRVIILDREVEAGRATAARLAAEGDVTFMELDVSNETAVVAAAAVIATDFGGVHVLCNNAGIGRLGTSLDFPLKDWQASFDVMATGTFLCSREFGKAMRASGGGTMVNIASINGIANFPMRLAYSAAKAAIVSMTRVLAVEWASYNIRVNAVAPGMTKTEMLQEAIDQGLIDVDAYIKHTPLRRFAKPEEMAEAVLYLASPRSSYITGQVIVPDGGWTVFDWIPWSGDPEAPGIL